MVKLTEAQILRLKKRLKTELPEWEQDWAPLQSELESRLNLIEGVVEDTDYPWDGASNLHIPIPLIYLKVYHTVERRSILGSGRLWYVVSGENMVQDTLADLEDGINYKAFHEWNATDAVDSIFWTSGRDGLGIIFVSYRHDVDEIQDEIEIGSYPEFLKEFPDAESAGMSQQEYDNWAKKAMRATEDETLKIPVTIEKIRYRGPWCDVCDLADFVVLPATAQSLSPVHSNGYGRQYWVRKGEVRRMMEDGEIDEVEAKKVLSPKGGSKPSPYASAKLSAQNIGESTESSDVRLFDLVYRFRPTPGGKEVKLMLTYSLEQDALLSYKEYDLPEENVVLFRIEKRPNQLIGSSVPGQLRDLSAEVDTIHNQRINSRSITEVPSFVCKPSVKNFFDPRAPENRFRPGTIFWLENADAFKQFETGNINYESSINEEDRTMKLCSLVTGVDPFTFSGNPQPDNPDAPGNKTLYLISQSNLRMDDVLSSLRDGIERLGEVLIAFERRYGPYEFSFMRRRWDGSSEDVSFKKSLLRTSGIRFAMAGTNVALNPESEFNRWFSIYNALSREPKFAAEPKRRIAVLRRALAAGRIEGRDEFLPTLEEIEADAQIIENQARSIEARRAGNKMLMNDVSQKEDLVSRLRSMTGTMPPGKEDLAPPAASGGETAV